MIFRIPRLIEHVSSIMTLEEGDLLLTGTFHVKGSLVPAAHCSYEQEPQPELDRQLLATKLLLALLSPMARSWRRWNSTLSIALEVITLRHKNRATPGTISGRKWG